MHKRKKILVVADFNEKKDEHKKLMDLLGFKLLNLEGTFTPPRDAGKKPKKTKNDTVHAFNLEAKLICQIPRQNPDGTINHTSDHDALVIKVRNGKREIPREQMKYP